jgi:hypothetical protein
MSGSVSGEGTGRMKWMVIFLRSVRHSAIVCIGFHSTQHYLQSCLHFTDEDRQIQRPESA